MAYTAKLGKDAKLTVGGTELSLVRDVTIELGGSEIDVSCRESDVKQYLLALKDISISGTAVYDPANPGITALIDSWEDGTALTVSLSDPTLSYTGKYVCTKVSQPQPLEGVMTIDFTLKPTPSEN
jgi:hypothetical protein